MSPRSTFPLLRSRKQRETPPTPRKDLDRHFAGRSSSLTVLVPTRDEDPTTIRSALWSAALQEYPGVRVVLLVDDVARDIDPEADDVWLLTEQIASDLSEPRSRFANAFLDYQQGVADSAGSSVEAVRELARQYGWASGWLSEWADQEVNGDNVDQTFVTRVMRGLASDLDAVRVSLSKHADAGRAPVTERMLELYRRLMWIFDAELVTFGRSQYDSLPRHSDRATNLDTFATQIGVPADDERAASGSVLSAVRRRQSSDFVYPDATYIVELAARSILVPEYALRLVFQLEQPGNERIAVTATAHSVSIATNSRLAGAPRLLEPRRPRSDADGRWVA